MHRMKSETWNQSELASAATGVVQVCQPMREATFRSHYVSSEEKQKMALK